MTKVNSEEEIDYIEKTNGEKIICNGNFEIAFDEILSKNVEYIIKIKTSDNIKEEKLIINDEYIYNNALNVENLTEETGITTLEITNHLKFENLYYKIGENSEWELASDIIEKNDVSDLRANSIVNDDNTINVYVKAEDNNSNTVTIKKQYKISTASGILNELPMAELKHDENYELTINNEKYNMHTYVYDGNQEWNSNMTFGNEEDVGTSNSYAKNMILVKVNGNLTIEKGTTITTYGSTYGGPKGMILYVTGDIINNGNISMTARGAYAEGQNVLLWLSDDGSIEFVPGQGGSGGNKATSSKDYKKPAIGNNGQKGTNRRTGGGASGGSLYSTVSGAGAEGTSYSGGAGGGGAFAQTAENAYPNGGKGGNGNGRQVSASWSWSCGGGAGNPGGSAKNGGQAGMNGTGGLLIIYSNNLTNNGTITSNGSKGGNGYRAGGGGSGGGSINIFYRNEYINSGSITANGGERGYGTRSGGETANGGTGEAGSVTIGSIIDGIFTKTYSN